MPLWNPTRIRWVNKTLDTSTGATHVETDSGPAYVKFMGNPEGPQALFCELIGTRAAAWLGLPTFDVAVMDVDQPGLATYENGTSSEPGPAFAARFEEGTPWGGTADELQAAMNPEATAGLIVLDTWLLNCDRYRPEDGRVRRNTRNVFLSAKGARKGKFRITAMDHTHCLTCGRPITPALAHIDRIKDERLYGHFPEFRDLLRHQDVAALAARLRTFTRATANDLLAQMPAPWSPGTVETTAVAELLTQRADFLGRHAKQMLVDKGCLQPELELGK